MRLDGVRRVLLWWSVLAVFCCGWCLSVVLAVLSVAGLALVVVLLVVLLTIILLLLARFFFFFFFFFFCL